MVQELAKAFDIDLVEPDRTGGRRKGLRSVLSPRPRLGWATTGLVDPDSGALATMVSHSYLAPMVVRPPSSLVIDFANIETDRQWTAVRSARPIERAVSLVEWAKGLRWERAVAAAAHVAVAVSERDATKLRRWGATDVIVVPNAVDERRSSPSPASGPVGVVATAGYGPNVEGLQWLVRDVWRTVRASLPGAQLHIAGLGTEALREELTSDGVVVLGTIEDVGAFYDSCAVVAAPIQRGGGSQLKVVEALGRGRVVVATPHSAAPFPDLGDGLQVAPDAPAFARTLVSLVEQVERRHGIERALAEGGMPTWEEACAPLVDALLRLAPPTP